MKKRKGNMAAVVALAGVAAALPFGGCVPVKEYQKSRLNDAEMAPAARKIEKTENSFLTYREGSSGANGGKTGGGCGCN